MPDLESIKRQLQERLAELSGHHRKIQDNLMKPGNRDWKEQATERENDEVLQRLGEAEQSEILGIRAVLDKVDDGTFGICDECGETIAAGRLEAVPTAALCVRCAE